MSIYEFGAFRLDVERLLLLHRNEAVPLGPKVVETLLALVEHPGDVLAKNTLLERIWPEGYVEEANLAQNIYVLRKTFRTLAAVDPIETVPRRGYRFTLAVQRIETVQASVPLALSQVKPKRIAAFLSAGAGAFALACAVFFTTAALVHHTPATTAGLSANGARLYEIGRYYWNQRTKPGVERSLEYFAQVTRTDPHDARGYAALAEANAIMGDYKYGSSAPGVYFARARGYADIALSLDPNLAEAHAALGLIAMDGRDEAQAVTEMQRAIALDPNYGPAHEWYGITLIEQGRLNDAFAQLQTAGDLDPLSISTTAWLASAAYLDRRYSDAIAYSRQTLDLAPQRSDILTILGESFEATGNYAQAIEVYQRYSASCDRCRAEGAALLAHAYAGEHRTVEARAQLAYALGHAHEVDVTDLAAAEVAVGDRTVALGLLHRMRGELNLLSIRNDPRFDALRGS
jgi:DNA-binding winged helix-turn-helix (wHTH) protein/Flp pilus assembly protein TadD